jgi:hypothetical protein
MSKSEDKFLDEIGAARPSFQPSSDAWASGERGSEVLERVLKVAETEASAADAHAGTGDGRREAGHERRSDRRRARWWTAPRVALAAAACVLVVLGVSLAVFFTGGSADQGPVTQASQPGASNAGTGSTPGTSSGGAGSVAGAEEVTKLSAVSDLMPLFRLKTSESFENLNGSSPGTLSEVNEAIARGLLTREEVSDGSAASPMTQGDYVVLLVKAFQTILPDTTFPTISLDAAATAEQRAAIEALAAAGIIVPADGPFTVARPLSKDVEARLLGRIEQAYKQSSKG